MPQRSRADVVRSYFAAFINKDRVVVENALSKDFTFTSPYDDAIDRVEYFARCWPNSERIRDAAIERISEHGDGAFVTYKLTMDDGRSFRNTEFITFDGDQIKAVDVYFGATYKEGRFVAQKPN
ncbi:nuclear transport factor 2 family protein [Pseudorhodoplanes sinuspersici]|uniref:DUF4440 domain-containing protein n=1 Tax=Pseudorhodoplanes sinuspersici TaxID=1235591 RepID=A0A1W6ZRH6_9HYPH|nr:nuclear transport factor 2 family protein [Pseudorhodoplanes sinuspersici]ARP99720.1 DUF4440 domain-containing protein [Pseudorhodoplanes sinuspersici]RKE70705.1 hypothetical protein DFP91_2947 [Pseudorhodoplanes sinuspersici]